MAAIDELIQRAQETNSAQVYEDLGRAFYFGNGAQKDLGRSLYYFKQAADLGSVTAKVNVGVMYYKAYGVDQNIKLAKKYLQDAADNGAVDALRFLGMICYNGDYGFFTGKGKAFTFWMQASKRGDVTSQIYVATSYLGDDWGEEQSFWKAAFWFTCAYYNRMATDSQRREAKAKLRMLDDHVSIDSIKAEVFARYPKYLNM